MLGVIRTEAHTVSMFPKRFCRLSPREAERRQTMHEKTFRLVLTALFMALVLLLGLTPLGLIPLGFINVTILGVPVLAGTLLLGKKGAGLLGFLFGTVSLLSMVGFSMVPPSALANGLFAAKPLYAILMCYVPRLLMPYAALAVYKLFSKGAPRCVRALPFAAAAGSLTNTIVYLGLMLLFYSVIPTLDASKILALIAGTGLIAGTCEAVVAAILVTAIVTALWKSAKFQLPEA